MLVGRLSRLLIEITCKCYQISELAIKIAELKALVDRIDRLLQWTLDD
jgi:hypothetical protein